MKIILVLLSVSIVTSCASTSKKMGLARMPDVVEGIFPVSERPVSPIAGDGCYAPSEFSAEDLFNDISANKVTSTSRLLDYLKKTPKYRGFFDHPVLLRSSGAIHGDLGPVGNHEVSPKFPRIELENGDVTLHFTANPAMPGRELVEIMEIDPHSARTHARLINFHLSGQEYMFLRDPDQQLTEDSEIYKLYVKTAGEGITSCSACHVSRQDEKGNNYSEMIWGPRSSQMGAYGNFENRIRRGSKEYQDFQEFRKTLEDPSAGELYGKIGFQWRQNESGDIDLLNANNTRFTEALYRKARFQAAKNLTQAPEYNRFQYAVMASFLGCSNIPDFLPEAEQRQREERIRALVLPRKLENRRWVDRKLTDGSLFSAIQDFIRSINQETGDPTQAGLLHKVGISAPNFIPPEGANAISDPNLFKDQQKIEDEFLSEDYTKVIAGIFYLFAGDSNRLRTPLYLPRDNYFTTQYRIDGGLVGLRQIVSCHVGPEFISSNPELRYFRNGIVHPEYLKGISLPAYCEKLKQRSLKAF